MHSSSFSASRRLVRLLITASSPPPVPAIEISPALAIRVLAADVGPDNPATGNNLFHQTEELPPGSSPLIPITAGVLPAQRILVDGEVDRFPVSPSLRFSPALSRSKVRKAPHAPAPPENPPSPGASNPR